MLTTFFLWLGNYISTKSNFLRVSVIAFGLPTSVVQLFLFKDAPLPVIGFVIVLGIAGGYIWGLAMWHLMFKAISARRAAHAQDESTTEER